MESYVPYWNEGRQAELSISGKDAAAAMCQSGYMNRIKEFRESREWTQEQLAEMVGVKHSTISKLETGKLELKERQIRLFATVFGVHPGDILGELPGDEYAKTLQDEMEDRLGQLLADNQALVGELRRIHAVLKEHRLALQPRAALRLPPPARPPKKE